MVAVRQLEAHPDEVVAPGRHLRVVEVGRPAAGGTPQGVYRRRRLVAVVLVAVVAHAALRIASPLLGDPAVPLEAGAVHVVEPGDTYWSIAGALDTDGDITGTVDALSAANGGRALQVGDRLVLPG